MPVSLVVMIVSIVLIGTIGKVLQARYRAMERLEKGGTNNADAMRAAEDVRQLKERIAVLERVITDNHGSLGLDREIERLRDR